MRRTMTAILCFLLSSAAFAQLPAPPTGPAFDVASVKPSAPDQGFSSFDFRPGPTARVVSQPLRDIISWAYDLGIASHPEDPAVHRLVGGPNALLSRSFDIEARTSPTATVVQKKAMLRTLLAERFRLRIHQETRQVPLYAVTLANKSLGPGLKRSTLDCNSEEGRALRAANLNKPTACSVTREELVGGIRIFRGAGPMSALAIRMYGQLDRPVIDETRLTGNFEWSITYRGPRQEINAPLFEDAVRQELGLRIVAKTGPYDVHVIDSVEMPTTN
jgi:uncharacterized protein (TIGR03435 family)